jgi:hypothetical protein
MRMENTSSLNKNTMIIGVKKRVINTCIFDRRAIARNRKVQVHHLVVIPPLPTRNSSIGTNILMNAKVIIKNSTPAVAKEAITDS